MIAAHPSVLDQEQQQLMEEVEQIIVKVSPYLTDDEVSLLCWAAMVKLTRKH